MYIGDSRHLGRIPLFSGEDTGRHDSYKMVGLRVLESLDCRESRTYVSVGQMRKAGFGIALPGQNGAGSIVAGAFLFVLHSTESDTVWTKFHKKNAEVGV